MRAQFSRLGGNAPPHHQPRRASVAVHAASPVSQVGPSGRPLELSVPKKPLAKDPFAEKTIYRDSWTDLAFIKIYAQKIVEQLAAHGQHVHVPLIASYEDFVRVSKDIMRGRSPTEQRMLVRNVLFSLMPDGLPQQFRRLFPPTQWSAEINARMASLGFGWLVGECELQEADVVVGPNGETRRQASVVLIKKCRYLEASGCVGLCTNLCKLPTQSFFTDDCGLPLTMDPDFTDLSCKMIFGQVPPPPELDAVNTAVCFRPQCTLATDIALTPCPKLTKSA